MIWLGLLVAVCFVPGYTGASIPTQWAVLSCLLPLSLWRPGSISTLHWLGLAFLVYACLSLSWTHDWHVGIWGLWVLGIAACSFWLGSTLASLDGLLKGLALGLSVSAVVAAFQAFNYHPVITFLSIGSPGLLYNPIAAGEACALVIIGLVTYRLYWFIPGPTLALILSHSRGAWLACAVGLVAIWLRRPLYLAIGLAAFGVAFTLHLAPSDEQRLQIWSVAWALLSPFGLGPGMFFDIFYLTPHGAIYPEYAHNDFLQLLVEYGIGAVPLFALAGLALTQRQAAGLPLFVAFLVMGLYSFPFYAPFTLFLGAAAAGGLARDWSLSRTHSLLGRPYLLSCVVTP